MRCVDHVDYTASTRPHELDHTDQEAICPAWQILIIQIIQIIQIICPLAQARSESKACPIVFMVG